MRESLILQKELDALFRKKNQHIKPGVENLQNAFKYYPGIECSMPSFLLGGTNGKGSTSGMLWHLLSVSGVKSGLYTSPHLVHFSERFQLSHQELNDSDLLKWARKIEKKLPSEIYESLSFFDLSTLMALDIFKFHECEWNVFEVGLGGRWDSTNAFDHDAMAIISIGLDHQSWLGDSLKEIAFEKLGIVREGCPLFWGEKGSQKECAQQALAEKQKSVNFPIYKNKENFKQDNHGLFEISLPNLPVVKSKFPDWFDHGPEILKNNFTIAASMFYWSIHQPKFQKILKRLEVVSKEAFFYRALERFAEARFPWPMSLIGRFQELKIRVEGKETEKKIILDVCHNIDSVQEFIFNIKSKKIMGTQLEKIPGIVSILKDKDVSGILSQLKRVLDPIVVFKVDNERSITKECLKGEHNDILLFEDFSAAWNHTQTAWTDDQKPWAVCGSFYGVGEVLKYFKVEQKKESNNHTLQGYLP